MTCLESRLITTTLVALVLNGFYARGQSSEILATRVTAFRAEGITALDALLQLGKQEHLPIGVEYLDRDTVERHIQVNLPHATVAQVLEAILGPNRGYAWRVRDGVIDTTHKGVPVGPKKNLFDQVVRRFSIPRVPLQHASLELVITLTHTLNPNAGAVFGDYPGGSLQNLVGPLRLDNATVRQILNRLVAQSRNAAWVVQVPSGHLDQLPSSGLWRIIEYDDSSIMQNAGEFFRHAIFGLTDLSRQN